MSISSAYIQLRSSIPEEVTLVSVSKTKPIEYLKEAYQAGARVFGENRVSELVEKHAALPKDIEWHMIGHLQSKKTKEIAPFISLIHSVDSIKLLEVINKEGEKNNRKINCLLQFHVAKEESKYGFNPNEVKSILTDITNRPLPYVTIKGIMGMATFTEDENRIREEFQLLHSLYQDIKTHFLPEISILSMGMSGDFPIAIEEGSTMVRVGSLLFGDRS